MTEIQLLGTMDLATLLKSKKFLEDIANSIKNIIFANFSKTSQEEREDIEQEVKLKIWKVASNGKKITNLRSYLWKVVYTTALDLIQERLPNASDEEIIKQIDSLNISRLELLSPELLLQKKEHADILKNEIHSLPKRRKAVLELYLSGMNLEEITEFLGWGQNEVRHLLYRGIQELTERVGESGSSSNRDNRGKFEGSDGD
jgi:RNA polymerase sigma-70 factor (ECF subfamily)